MPHRALLVKCENELSNVVISWSRPTSKMQFWFLFIFLISSLALLVPGACLWDLLFPEQSIFERCIWGSVCGLAIAVYIAFVLAYWRLSLFWMVWAALSLAVAALTVRQHLRNPSAPQRLGVTRLALMILALLAISRFFLTVVHTWPPGWDPSFHLILARKVAMANGMIYDWTPFENVPLNYPLGSHFLLVALSSLNGLPLHRVFQMLIPLIGVITTAEVYLLCLRFQLDEEVAAFSALAYGFWAAYGSLDYYRTGGLPNALAMTFLLAIIALLATPALTPKHVSLIALFFTAICLAHHHVMITSGIVLAVLFVYFFFSNQRRAAVAILIGGAGGMLLGAFYLAPYLLKAASLGNTDVFRFQESFTARSLFRDLGPAYVLFSAAGLLLAWRARNHSAGLRWLYVICGTLLTLFVLSGPIYRQLAIRFTGQDFVAFTPSRFLMDMACFMSIFAGYAASQLRQRFGVSLTIATALGIFLTLSTYRTWQQMIHEGGVPIGSWGAYNWISENTPPDTIVLNTNSYASLVSWRQALYSPLPISEPRHLDAALEEMRKQLREGNIPQEARSHKLVKVIPPDESPANQVLWKDPDGWSVVEVWPGPATDH
jgi:hypothetical protein